MNHNNDIEKRKRINPLRYSLILPMFVLSVAVLAVTFSPPGDPGNPINIIAFPQRDFVSASGYTAEDRVLVRVIHDPTIYPGRNPITTDPSNLVRPIDPPAVGDPADPALGIVEVNHPGGACWFGNTPDIRPGDKIQIEIMANAGDPSRVGRIDETIVQNIVAKRPVLVQAATPGNNDGIVAIHGTAQDSFNGVPVGNPLPIGSLEQRLVAPGDIFAKSNKRTLRAASVAGADGTLTYDQVDNPDGIKWTATYSGLSQADVDLALGAESRGMWINVNPNNADAGEITTYETGAAIIAGPQAPCNAPFETLPAPAGTDSLAPSVPQDAAASTNGTNNTVTINWTASTDTENGANDNPGVTSYGVYRINGVDGIPVAIANVQKPDGTAPAPTTYVDKNVPPGTYTYKVDAADSNGNRSVMSGASPEVTTIIQNPPAVTVNEPPANGHALLAFPSRDFVAAENYAADELVTIQVIRNNIIISTAEGLTPDAEGLVEVNHPGGGCWDGVTPELRAGDIVRATAYKDGNVVSVDQIHVANVTASMPTLVTAPGVLPATIKITGTAQDANGQPIDIGQLEQRLIGTSRDPFDLNGRRALIADAGGAGEGTFSYDLINNQSGIKWTATYTLETQHDVDLALSVESRILWLGRDPLAGIELTLFENGLADPPGPAVGFCSAAIETPDELAPSMPLNFSASNNANENEVTFSWNASSDFWGIAGYKIYDNGTEAGIAAPNATSFVLANVTPGNHTYTLRAFDNASPLVGAGDFATRIMAGLGRPYGNLSAPASLSTVNGTPSGDGTITLRDVLFPSAPTNLIGIARNAGDLGAFIDLTWTAATDNVGVTKYVIHRSPSGTGTGADFEVAGNVLSYTDTLSGANSRDYSVSACDAANNCTLSSTITVQIPAEFDEVAPSWPPNTTVTAINTDIHTRNVTVSWTAALDNLEPNVIARYDLFRVSGGITVPVLPTGAVAERIATIAGDLLTYADTVPAAGTYRYALIAYDTAGNPTPLSPVSGVVTVALDAPGTGHSLIGFPARDFISASGYNVDPQQNFHFELIRNIRTFASGSIQNALGDVAGVIEVNHPGGTCWNITTPDMRPGDVIRIINEDTGIAEQTVVSNVTAERPIAINANTIVIHGTAQQTNGQPIPIGQLEHRLVASSQTPFEKNGNRTLRAPTDGTLAYDALNNPTGIKWTATYTGLSTNDMLLALGGTSTSGTVFVGAESRIVWLGRVPLAGNELTIFENGPGVTGGSAGPACTAADETPVANASFDVTSVSFGNHSFNPLAPANAPQRVTLTNNGGAPMSISNIYLAGLNPGDFSIAANTCPLAPAATLANGASCTVDVQFLSTAMGLRQAYLNFTDNAANTTDQSIQLTGTGVDTTDPRISLSLTTLGFGTVNGGASSTRTVTVTNIGTGLPLNLTAPTFGGAAGSDYSIAPTSTCSAGSSLPANGGSCNFDLVFRPSARGARTATFTINHNRALPGSTTSTNVTLNGTGGNGAVLSLNNNSTFSFTAVTRNTSQTKTLTVKNSGNATVTPALSLASFATAGADAAQFTLVSTDCGALAAGKSCNLNIRFTAPNAVRTFNATLSVFASNGFPQTRTINLTATTR